MNHTGVVWDWLTAGTIKRRAVKIVAESLYIKYSYPIWTISKNQKRQIDGTTDDGSRCTGDSEHGQGVLVKSYFIREKGERGDT